MDSKCNSKLLKLINQAKNSWLHPKKAIKSTLKNNIFILALPNFISRMISKIHHIGLSLHPKNPENNLFHQIYIVQFIAELWMGETSESAHDSQMISFQKLFQDLISVEEKGKKNVFLVASLILFLCVFGAGHYPCLVIHAKQFSHERPWCKSSHADGACSNTTTPIYLLHTHVFQIWCIQCLIFVKYICKQINSCQTILSWEAMMQKQPCIWSLLKYNNTYIFATHLHIFVKYDAYISNIFV